MEQQIKTKICRDCKEEKEYDLLATASISKKDGTRLVKNICKVCWNKRRELARKANISEARTLANKRRWSRNSTGDKEKNRRLLRNYGITIEDFKQMLEEQNNKCLICEQDLLKPHVDHCHETGRIRGVLCASCNTGMGLFGDSAEILQKAIEYIKK